MGGLVGRVLAATQRALSFHSAMPPISWVWRDSSLRRWSRWKIGIEWSRPYYLPFVFVFLLRDEWANRPRWFSFRAGWRWDLNWGRGGYIADVIVKSKIDNLVE